MSQSQPAISQVGINVVLADREGKAMNVAEKIIEKYGEPANVLAINLAHDIPEDGKTVEEPRERCTEIYDRKKAGSEPDYITGLQFEPPEGDQRDSDEKTLTEEHKERAQEDSQDDGANRGINSEAFQPCPKSR